MAETVNTPVVPEVVKQVPLVVGLDEAPIQTPLPVTAVPPSLVTFPPRVAVILAMSAFVGVVTVGASRVVKVSSLL